MGEFGRFVVLMAVCSSFLASAQSSPVGAWKTVDDKTGKARAVMRLIDGGARLEVRGYLGISLFGRTQLWERLE